jgi:hypothetical protein
VGSVYEDLSQTVTKSDLQEVRDVIGELAQAQQRTEARMEELAKAQREMAEAQRQTQVEIRTATSALSLAAPGRNGL